jgi:hypothetical protein
VGPRRTEWGVSVFENGRVSQPELELVGAEMPDGTVAET